MDTLSVAAWRKSGNSGVGRAELWSPHRQFFQSCGYTLWILNHGYDHEPPNDNPRAPDGFSYENEFSADMPEPRCVSIGSPLHFPARTTDNRDVLIVLLSDGIVGENCVDVLRKIATGKNAGIDRNHTLPLLDEIHYENLVFGVFPLVGSSFIPAWFSNIAHALESMSQIMEGVAFLHDHLVVHRDLFLSNFLSSRRSDGRWDPEQKQDFLRPRYYIIDFEWAVRFSPDSDPASRTVTGPPLPWDIYRRPPPPEMQSELPYCPFKADVWQVGKSFMGCILHIEHVVPDVLKLFRQMSADSAEDRPSAREAVTQLNKIRNGLPTEILQACIEELYDYDVSDDFREDEFFDLVPK
ncbi:hypothetical protein GGU11DRAFT_744173 [Lentinula aff. detonsa]|uniref:Protein kinase domain-containing protein n=1 Tax=Lentinula aff. detonsa TaxID=2804958 RepID=A0AA38NPU4_9AGAR|nr:hypothetical protein GGU10DRAFT_289715 [Lentinula aff. detonsa]KAJ3798567.1 hypothetical protein GGU11DRAFT_744173 [Lentinula aff. detonsa]